MPAPAEIGGNLQDAVDLPIEHQRRRLAIERTPSPRSKATAKISDQRGAVGRHVFVDHGDGPLVTSSDSRIRTADHHHRKHDADGDAAGIAQDLPRSLRVSAQIRRHFACQSLHERFRPTCARLGARLLDDGDEGVLHRRDAAGLHGGESTQLAPGVPWASTLPPSRISARSQYSASAMKCVVTMTVTPLRAAP
jgi:hypothetical protein